MEENSVKCVKVTCTSCNCEIVKKYTNSKHLEEYGNMYKINDFHVQCLIYSNKYEQQRTYQSEIIKCAKCQKSIGCQIISASEEIRFLLDHILITKESVKMYVHLT
jgi:hypothetical protein